MWIFGLMLALFVIVPAAELTLLLVIHGYTNLWFTLGLVFVTGFLGAVLARWQGGEAWVRVRQELAQGKMPAGALVDSFMIFIAGLLLLTPGVITDIIGFSLLVPWFRHLYKLAALAWLRHSVHVHMESVGVRRPASDRDADSDVVDSYATDHDPASLDEK